MDRVRLFQRCLITALTGINTFVFSISNQQGIAKSFIYSLGVMLATVCCIQIYAAFKRMENQKRISQKQNG